MSRMAAPGYPRPRRRFGVADANLAVGRDRRWAGWRLVRGAPEGPRGPTEPSAESPLESTRILVAEQEPHLRHGEPAIAQERWCQLATELREHSGERRLLVPELTLE